MNILGVLVVGPRMGDALEEHIYGVALSVLAASVLQIVLIVPVLRAHGCEGSVVAGLSASRTYGGSVGCSPRGAGTGGLLLNVFFDAQIGTFLTRGPEQGPPFRYSGTRSTTR